MVQDLKVFDQAYTVDYKRLIIDNKVYIVVFIFFVFLACLFHCLIVLRVTMYYVNIVGRAIAFAFKDF